MSLKYGLNVKTKAPIPSKKPSIFDDEDNDDDDVEDVSVTDELSSLRERGPPKLTRLGGPPSRPLPKLNQDDSRQNLTSMQAAQSKIKDAKELDSSIFDYDSFHDAKASVTEAKKAAARQDAIERKPRYMNNLLDAAARRKQDQQVAQEKLLQREREAEGDEFADKEKFVTGAYKKQQEENQRLEEEEKRKAEAEEQRRRKLGGGSGMQGFYRNMMDQTERQHRETIAAATQRLESGNNATTDRSDHLKEKSDAELAAEAKSRGITVHLNDEGQITDKRQLLSAGLNVGTSKGRDGAGRGAEHLRASNDRRGGPMFGGRATNDQRQAQRERQSRMLEEQLAEQRKRAREEDDEERARLEKTAKTTKTDKDVGDARARFLARKAARERGEG